MIISKNEINTTYYCVFPKSKEEKTIDGQEVFSFSQENDVLVIDEARKRYIPIVKKQIYKDILTDITKSTSIKYDNYGNITEHTTTTGNLVETIKTSYKKRTSAGVAYLPDTITNIAKQEEDIHTRKTVRKYDSNGSLLKEILDPNAENELTTEYRDYDTFGRPNTIEVTADHKTRTSSITYTSSGCFIGSKTDVLGNTTIYDWNETRGLLKSQTNRIGTTNFVYDSMGRLIETIYPDGKREANVLQWASDSNLGAKYYLYSELSGNSPVYTWYNDIGQEILRETYGLNNRKISIFTEYQNDGNIKRISTPTFNSKAENWDVTYIYDVYGRIDSITTPMGATNYAYNGRTTTIATPEGVGSSTVNSARQTITSKLNGKAVNYTYYPSGLTKTVTPDGGQALTMEYDLQGNRTKLVDPDAGVIESAYNGFGELMWTKQKMHNDNNYITTTNNYATNGLLQNTMRIGKTTETTTYVYDNKKRISSIAIANQHKQTFTYDNFDRILSVKEEIDGKTFSRSTEYDLFGRVKKETYPTGYYTQNSYNDYGYLTEVKDRSGRSIWRPLEENARGQLTKESKGGQITTYEYDGRGFPSYTYSPGVMDILYDFDAKGNLIYRDDYAASTAMSEKFTYDNMNRLTDWEITRSGTRTPYSIAYNSAGNIQTKTDLGNFTLNYDDSRSPHALTSISGIPENFPTENLNITYTDFKKIKTLTEGDKNYALTYGVDGQRRKSVYLRNNVFPVPESTSVTCYYIGNYEEKTSGGTTEKIHYLSGGAILIDNNGVETLYYGYYDYQGSLQALVNENGTVVERYAYDPWGKRRNSENWAENDTRTGWLIDRGYTGHEHLDAFGIINMNGRVYDPLTASFFSPDPYIQAPDNWLNYNRYSYCYGNPFKYTDPSGELLWEIIVGAAIYAGLSYAKGVRDNGGERNPLNWSNYTLGIGYSSTNNAVFLGASPDGNNFLNFGTAISDFGRVDALRVGTSQNGVTQMASPFYIPMSPEQAVLGAEKNVRESFGYPQGGGIGLMTSMLNHVQHKTEEYKFFWRLKRHYNEGTGDDFKINSRELDYIAKKGKIGVMGNIDNGIFRAPIDLYGSGLDLALSFGNASIFYDTNGNVIDFYDYYDFDPKPWGEERSIPNEIITRGYNLFGSGTPFHIYHKINFRIQ